MFFHKKDRGGCGETACANTSHFANIFVRDLGSLFRLGLLLTTNPPDAERCLLEALDLCSDGAMVHVQWASAWARRCVIKSAIQIVSPNCADNCGLSNSACKEEVGLAKHVLDGVCRLPVFDRFVFVISILEKFPCRECSVLLNCAQGDIAAARIRALRQLVKFDEISPGGQDVRLDPIAAGIFRPRLETDCVRRATGATRSDFRSTSTEYGTKWARLRS